MKLNLSSKINYQKTKLPVSSLKGKLHPARSITSLFVKKGSQQVLCDAQNKESGSKDDPLNGKRFLQY